jgi:hypothetical protein
MTNRRGQDMGSIIKNVLAIAGILFINLNVCYLYGLETEISPVKMALQTNIGWDYNKSFSSSLETSIILSAELWEEYEANAGFKFATNSNFQNYIVFAKLKSPLTLLKWEPLKMLKINVLYQSNGIPDYNMRAHSLVPYITLDTKYFSVSAGWQWKWNLYFNENAVKENLPVLSMTGRPIVFENITAGITISNFDEFYSISNFLDFYLKLFCEYHFNKHISASAEMTLFQKGLEGMVTNFYGSNVSVGVRILW